MINSHRLFISRLNLCKIKYEIERQNRSNPGDSPETTMRNKTTEFLTDAAERIIVMTKVYTRLTIKHQRVQGSISRFNILNLNLNALLI